MPLLLLLRRSSALYFLTMNICVAIDQVLPTRELGKDLGRLYTRGVAGADMVLVVVTSVRQMRFPVLAGLVSARCPVLKVS